MQIVIVSEMLIHETVGYRLEKIGVTVIVTGTKYKAKLYKG
jgi:hypothetical protein